MAFDILMNILIVINLIAIAIELSTSESASYMIYLKYINYSYFGIFMLEAIIKVNISQFYIISVLSYRHANIAFRTSSVMAKIKLLGKTVNLLIKYLTDQIKVENASFSGNIRIWQNISAKYLGWVSQYTFCLDIFISILFWYH